MKTTLSVVLLLALAAGGALATDGVYVDNLQVTNDGILAFPDAFDNAKVLRGWTRISDVSIAMDSANRRQGAMLLNRHVFAVAAAYHNVELKNVGTVEMSAAIYCTAPSEQYDWRVKKKTCSTTLIIYSGSSKVWIDAVVQLDSKQSAYQVGILAGGSGGKNIYSTRPVLQPGKWALLTMWLDPVKARATLFLDGKTIVSTTYDPNKFQSIQEVAIQSQMGDGSQRTD